MKRLLLALCLLAAPLAAQPSRFSLATQVQPGFASTALGDTYYALNATTFGRVAGNVTTTRKFWRQVGTGSLSAAPDWDTLVSGDIPSLDVAKITTGVFPIVRGGTGTASTLVGLVRGSASAMTAAEISGDGTTSGSNVLTITKLNGTSLAGLVTGILKNTTGTGVPSIAALADIPSALTTKGDLPCWTTLLTRKVVGTTGYVLTADPTDACGFSWGATGTGTVTSVSGSGGTTGLTLTGGPITGTGTLTLSGTLAAANVATLNQNTTGTAGDGLTSATGTAPLTLGLSAKALTGSIAITPTNPGGAVALQATTGTTQTGNLNIDGAATAGRFVGPMWGLRVYAEDTSNSMTLYGHGYSVPTATFVTINLNAGVSALTAGWVYRVKLVTTGTSAPTGAVFIVYRTGATTWAASMVSANLIVSNSPLLQVSGTSVQIYHNHASTYTIATFVEGFNDANTVGTTTASFFGLEGAMTNLAGNIGFGTVAPNVLGDFNGAIATRKGTVAVANGLNSNIATPAFSYVRLTGPTAVFSIGGFTLPSDGRQLVVYDTVAFAMTIVNEDASSTAANRIKTLTGANVTLRAGTSAASFIYDVTDSRWILVSSN